MSVKLTKQNAPASELDLQDFCDALGHKIPSDYAEFLAAHNGCIPESNSIEIPDTNNSVGVNEFCSISQVLAEKARLCDRLISDALPIAWASCGNLICLMLAGESWGEVWFWDHELEAEEGEQPNRSNMFRVAGCFSEFCENLTKFDPKDVELEPGHVKRSWIDPEFLKQIKGR